MDLQELSKANLVLFRPLHFCAAAFGLYRWQILGCAANLALSGCVVPAWHTGYPSGKYEVSHGIFSDSDFLFSLCFIHIFSGTPWQFIFFFGTCCVPAVNLGLPGGKLVVAHIKSVCYMPCFFGQRQYLYYTDYIRKLQLNLLLIITPSISQCLLYASYAPHV